MTAKLVIAEDEEGIRNNLARLLKLEGYEVWAGANGRQALELVWQHQPDLVISDVMMPEMTGHQLIQNLRADARGAHIPVILLTARADRGDVRAGMDLGADDYLTKPFQRDEVLASVRSRLDKQAAQRAAAQRLALQSHHLAHYDRATDLPNRSHFQLLVANALAASREQTLRPQLWAVSLDNLAELAHVLTTAALDDVAREVARRLSGAPVLAALGRGVAARLSDNRAGVLIENPVDDNDLERVASALLDSLSEPLQAGGEAHFPVFSVAGLRLDDPQGEAGMALARLELALAHARAQPGRRIKVDGTALAPEVGATLRLHNDLHQAVSRKELRAYYQPQLAAASRALRGFEALMRWEHPQHGLVSPARFVPLAEDNGQIVPMGAWMLRQACHDAMAWPGPWRVAVNLSLRQFGDPAILEHVAQALGESGLPPQRLELEITEGTAMLDLQHTLALLGRFKAMGCQLAIDDFGTGYSSLAYLKRFPLDVLKIDQSFVRQITTDAEDRAIARAVIQLAHALDMHVIAEGVEHEAQHQLLHEMGCDEVQGYLHGRPMPVADLAGWLQQRDAATL